MTAAIIPIFGEAASRANGAAHMAAVYAERFGITGARRDQLIASTRALVQNRHSAAWAVRVAHLSARRMARDPQPA